MQYRSGQSKPPASVKHANNFFPTKPFSPSKHDVSYQYYMSENPTPVNQYAKKAIPLPTSNIISINNGLQNQVYYIQPGSLANARSQEMGHQTAETIDQVWSRGGPSQQRRFSKPQNSSYHTTNNQVSNKQLMQEDPKQRSKAQNQLFQMLMNDAMAKASGQHSDSQQRRNSRTKFQSNETTPHSSYVGDKRRATNNSLQRRLEETYQLKTQKTKQTSFNAQTANWYLPKKREQSTLPAKQQSINFNQTVPHQKPQKNYYLNQSLEGQNTGEVSFENNILQRGFQGDYSGYLQIQSDTSKNILDDAHQSGNVVRQVGKHHTRALELLELGKDYLRGKKLVEAIDVLKQSVNIDPTLLESHYFLGIGWLGNQQYAKAISEFQSIISQDSQHRKNVYLLLAISYKKINELEQAIQSLSKSLSLFPRYYDALIYRGKLFIKCKQLDKAMVDFQTAIQSSPLKGLGYLGKADCLRYAGNFNEAIRMYQKAIQCEVGVSQAACLKKAITLFEAKQYEESVQDFDKILLEEPSNSEAYYFKGLCRLKMRNSQEALLCFEQSIKHNNSQKAVTKSLYEIAKIKIEGRDFYAAYHTLNRADFLDTEKSYLEKFRLFTEGVIFLMKRKFADSLVNFKSIQQNHSLNEFLKPLFYAYRSYGYFCLSQHQKALDDYKQLSECVGQLDSGACYNKLLCEGIIRVSQTSHEQGMDYFERAARVYPKRMEPLFYKGVTLVNKAFHSSSLGDQQKMALIHQGLVLIDQAQHLNEQNANILYIRAIIKAFLQNYEEAVLNIDKAIEKSEDNVPKYFFLRALIYACSKQYKPAVSDFSICINLDESYAEAYLQRAKCYFLHGDSTQAFADLQTYISLQPDDPLIHVWAGNFLFSNAAIEDAIKAYSHAPDFARNPQLLFLRAQCHLVMGQLHDCHTDILQLCQVTTDGEFAFDRECIQSILVVFRDAEEIYFDEENEQERLDLQKRLMQTIHLLSSITKQDTAGRLFRQHHIHIFRGVCLFHLRKYEDSLKDFTQAKSHKELHITEKRLTRSRSQPNLFTDDPPLADISEEEEDADLLEVLEIRFNELACLVMLKQYRRAKDRCKQLIDNINETKQEGLQYLLLALEKEIRKSEGKDYIHIDCQYDKIICLYDDPKENSLCFQVPIVSIPILNLRLRLSFSYPKITPPSLVPILDNKLIREISPLSVENKPEAPWIRRNELQGDMIMFTDKLQMMEDIRLETEDNEKEEKQVDSISQHYEEPPIDRGAMKKNLMLDLDIEEKLRKILEHKKKQSSQ